MDKLIISTDGSYSDGVGGFSFLLSFPNSKSNDLIAYGKIVANNPLIVEMYAIKRALQFLITEGFCNYNIEIKCDLTGVINIINKLSYNSENKYKVSKNKSKFIKSNYEFIKSVITLIELFPEDSIKFFKVKSKMDKQNKIVHKYANYIRKSKLLEQGCLYVLEKEANETSNKLIKISNMEDKSEVKISFNKESSQVLQKAIKWYEPQKNEIVLIPTKDICIEESIHLKCSTLDLNGILAKTKLTNSIDIPLAVRNIGQDKYCLVMGLTRFIAIKTLDIPKAPCFIINMNHSEFKNTFIMK